MIIETKTPEEGGTRITWKNPELSKSYSVYIEGEGGNFEDYARERANKILESQESLDKFCGKL